MVTEYADLGLHCTVSTDQYILIHLLAGHLP